MATPAEAPQLQTARAAIPTAKALEYRLHAGILFGVAGLLRRMGTERAVSVGGWIGRTLLAPLGRRSRSTLDTLRLAYPQLSDAEAARLLTGTYENIGRIIAELAILERFVAPQGWERFTVTGLDHLEAARRSGKGLIIATGHFANWEMIGVALHHLGVPYSAVTRPPNNPWVADWISAKRAAMGTHQQIPKGSDGTRRLFSTLRRGEPVVMLIDQHLAEGIPAPLFGQPAMTTHAPATFADKLDLLVLPMSVRRIGTESRFEVVFEPALAAARSGDAGRDVLQLTTALNGFIEREVRRRPEHWLWMHRRFKPVQHLTRRASRMVAPAGEDGSV